MKILWWTIIRTSALRPLKAELLKLAHLTNTPIQNPMSLKTSSMLAVITAAIAAITRSRQANAATQAALDAANTLLTPLQRENANLKIQKQQLETADDQLDEALTQLRASLDEADQPAVEEEDPQQPDLFGGPVGSGDTGGLTDPVGDAGSANPDVPTPAASEATEGNANPTVESTPAAGTPEGNAEALNTGGSLSGAGPGPDETGSKGKKGKASGN